MVYRQHFINMSKSYQNEIWKILNETMTEAPMQIYSSLTHIMIFLEPNGIQVGQFLSFLGIKPGFRLRKSSW